MGDNERRIEKTICIFTISVECVALTSVGTPLRMDYEFDAICFNIYEDQKKIMHLYQIHNNINSGNKCTSLSQGKKWNHQEE